MTDKLEALSQPVAYTLRFKNDDGTPESRINTNTTFSNKEAAQGYGNGGRYKTRPDGKMEWVRDKALDPDVVALYSQEYVTALLAALEALKAKTSTAMGVGNGSGNLFVYGDYDSIKAAQLIVLKNEKLRAALKEKDQQIAELQQRLQQPALADVMTERQRQINAEGWTSEHDDEHENNEMAFAAACYALYAGNPYPGQGYTPPEWPWDASWWKPRNPRRDLVKAGALILAEIERLDRESAKATGSVEPRSGVEK